MESWQTDVLIVGAGPAGAATAIRLAHKNVHVTLVDKSEFPRVKVCGDGLTPHSVAVLHGLGIDPSSLPSARRFGGLMLVAPDNSTSYLAMRRDGVQSCGFVVQRRYLDQALVERAISVGAKFVSGLHVTSPIIEGGQVCGANGELNGRNVQIRAKLTIAADGSVGGFSARLRMKRRRTTSEVAMRTYFANVETRYDVLQVYYCRHLLPAYGWVFPLGDGIANVGVGLDGCALAHTNLYSVFQMFVKEHPILREQLHHAEQIEKPRGFPLRSAFNWRAPFAAGVLLVGDAAGLVHPFTGEGIRYALESGELAATHAVDALANGEVSTEVLRAYGQELQRRYRAMHRVGNGVRFAFHSSRIARLMLARWGTPVSRNFA